MIYVEGWIDSVMTIMDLKVGDVFTDYVNKSPRGAYLFMGEYGTKEEIESTSVKYHMPYKGVDLLVMEHGREDPSVRFGEIFVRKGILTEGGRAMVAGLLASGV